MTFLFAICFLSCNVHNKSKNTAEQKQLTPVPEHEKQIEKASLEKELRAHNHLPINERIALYHRLKKEDKEVYDFTDEKELNQYGYSLLFSGKGEEAIEIFKLLVAEFPGSSNAYDSLGEAYKICGDEKNAIVNYKKSYELNPENEHAQYVVDLLEGRLDILEADSTWGKEMFKFPISFAPEIDYRGVEEARFSPGWSKQDSEEHWSYVFAWNVNISEALAKEDLEAYLKLYFDGLMKSRSQEEPNFIKTSPSLKKIKVEKGFSRHQGTVEIFEGFYSKKTMTLNAIIDQYDCPQKKKPIIVFRFSPQQFEHDIWDQLEAIKVRSNICEL